ncbi:TRIO and F-actin binding protein b isoform X2 [Ictalurus furcatus]|uniref:TRIO and F-actin binding protein b isoform X2 n=1 Tax=Ictalurus furcatus TaxID=66913 RepID=UPI002350C31A|nr:TRIO and F-actin binding protein b isoform X2 [Ictalurus furcatus]
MGKSTNSSTAGSWRGSTHSLESPPISRNSSPSRKYSESKLVGVRKSAHVSWSTGDRRQGQDNHRPSCRNRSPSPLMRNHTSSQSSIDSLMSSGSSGLNREEYAIMADLPKVKRVLQRARPKQMEGMERGNRDETSLYKPASHSHAKPAHITWDDLMDQRGNPSPTHTSSHTQGNKMEQEKNERLQQPDLLNFKKGWMSKLDGSGEWKKHWFVLTDAGLKYYRDSGAEEKDELDGEIDLCSCLKVSEFDVEKNYGFQIQTASGVFTLSAMTAGIRRNWIEILRKNIRPSSTPDLTQLPDSTSNREESRHHSSRRQSDSSSTPAPTQRKFDYVELSPVATPTLSAPANQREAGEGQVREHGQGQEDKSRNTQRETVISRKWPGRTPEQKRLEEEIERKWEEFERLPLKPTVSLSALGSLQREVASLTQLTECVRGEGCVCACEGGVCVCQSCSVSLEQMERAHRHALEELQRKHQRQTAEIEREKERLLNEETQATARAMEALRKAHKEELEREVQKAKHLTTQTAGTHTVPDQQQQELMSLRRELDGLSDRYSQKCLELNREQQTNGEKERQISMKEREMEQLRRQNQDLQSRLTEEFRRMRSFVTGQRSEEGIVDGNKGRSVCELEVLLRVKHNELEYLHKEIMCLRNEVQFLTTEKQSVCVQYQNVCEELKVLKERSEGEVQTLQEHLRLTIAALQEERGLHNSI